MRLRVFASHWGNFQHFGSSMPALLNGLKYKGFAGLEASLSDLGEDARTRSLVAEKARAKGLRLIVGLYSSWDDYEGAWTETSPDAQLGRLERQFDAAAELPEGVVAHARARRGRRRRGSRRRRGGEAGAATRRRCGGDAYRPRLRSRPRRGGAAVATRIVRARAGQRPRRLR